MKKTCKSIFRRTLSFMVTAAMCLSLLPAAAFAADGESTGEAAGDSIVQEEMTPEAPEQQTEPSEDGEQPSEPEPVEGEDQTQPGGPSEDQEQPGDSEPVEGEDQTQPGDSSEDGEQPGETQPAEGEETQQPEPPKGEGEENPSDEETKEPVADHVHNEDGWTCVWSGCLHEHNDDECYTLDENGEKVLNCTHECGEECFANEAGEWNCTAPEKEPVEEIPAEVQAFLDAVAAIPEITPENAAEAAEYIYGPVSEAYEALLGTEYEEREDVQEAAAIMADTIDAVNEALSMQSGTYDNVSVEETLFKREYYNVYGVRGGYYDDNFIDELEYGMVNLSINVGVGETKTDSGILEVWQYGDIYQVVPDSNFHVWSSNPDVLDVSVTYSGRTVTITYRGISDGTASVYIALNSLAYSTGRYGVYGSGNVGAAVVTGKPFGTVTVGTGESSDNSGINGYERWVYIPTNAQDGDDCGEIDISHLDSDGYYKELSYVGATGLDALVGIAEMEQEYNSGKTIIKLFFTGGVKSTPSNEPVPIYVKYKVAKYNYWNQITGWDEYIDKINVVVYEPETIELPKNSELKTYQYTYETNKDCKYFVDYKTPYSTDKTILVASSSLNGSNKTYSARSNSTAGNADVRSILEYFSHKNARGGVANTIVEYVQRTHFVVKDNAGPNIGDPITYQVIREYYLNGEKVDTITTQENGRVGDMVKGSDLAAAHPDWTKHSIDGVEQIYAYKSSTPLVLKLVADTSKNIITLKYALNNLPTAPTINDLNITKKAEGMDSDGKYVECNSYTVGDEIRYTITVSNSSSMDANVTVTDTLPEGLSFVSASDEGTNNNGTITWNVTVPAKADGKNGEKTVTVTANATGTGTIKNTATVTLGDKSKSDDETVTVAPKEASIEVEKTNDGLKLDEDSGTLKVKYTVTITNKSGYDIYGLRLTDVMEQPILTKTNEEDEGEPSVSLTFSNWKVDGKDAELMSTSADGLTHVLQLIDRGTKFTNNQVVKLTYSVEVESLNDEVAIKVKLNNEAEGASWSKAPKIPSKINAKMVDFMSGFASPFRMFALPIGDDEPDVTDKDDSSASTDPDAPDVSDKDDSSTEGDSGSTTEGIIPRKYKVTYTWENMPEGAQATLPEEEKYLAKRPVTVNSEYTDASEVTVTVNGVEKTYVFSGWKTEDATVENGQFTMPEKNVVLNGKWTAKAYTVTYKWSGLPYGTTDPKVPDPEIHDRKTEVTVNDTFNSTSKVTLGEGENAKTYVFSGWSTNDATVTDGKFTMPEKDVTISGEWKEAGIRVFKAVSGTDPGVIKPVKAGETVVFDITVENTGKAALSDIKVTDTLPDGMSYVSDDFKGEASGQTVTWVIPSLEAGMTQEIHITAKVADTATAGRLTNKAEVEAGTMKDEDSATVVVNPKLTGIEKKLVSPEQPITVKRGESVILRYAVTVKGDKGAKYVVSDDADLETGSSSSGEIGESGEAVIYFTKTVTPTDADAEAGKMTVENTAFVKPGVDTDPIKPTDPNNDPTDPEKGYPSEKVETEIKIVNPALTSIEKALDSVTINGTEVNKENLTARVNDVVVLKYSLTVKGDKGANYAVSDANSDTPETVWEGTLGEDGKAVINVTKTVTLTEANAEAEKVTVENTALIKPGENTDLKPVDPENPDAPVDPKDEHESNMVTTDINVTRERVITITWLRNYSLNDETIIKRDERVPANITADGISARYPEDPTRAGYEFIGWGNRDTDELGNITIRALWRYVGPSGPTTSTDPTDPTPGDSDTDDDPDPDPTPVTINVPNTPTPLAEIPETPVPLADSSDLIDIFDDDVPLAGGAQTGNNDALWYLLAVISLAGLGIVKLLEKKNTTK